MVNPEAFSARETVYKLCLLLATVLTFFLSIEVALRVLNIGNPNFEKTCNEGKSCRYHHLLGWAGIPNLKRTVHYNEELGSVRISLNSGGFRDIEHRVEKKEHVKRILFLGDSFTLGYATPAEYRFSNLVQQALPDEYEVFNMGLWGYSTDQYFITLNEKGLTYKPDLVVTALFLDDPITDNAYTRFRGRYIKPKFALTQNTFIELANVPVPDNRTRSFFYNFFISRYLELKNRLEIGFSFYRNGFPGNIIDKRYYESGNFDITLHIIKKMHDTAKQRNSRFLLVIIPMEFQLHEEEIRKGDQGLFGVPKEHMDITLTQKTITRFCNENQIPVLDLLPGFRHYGKREKLFFHTDLHFNRNGHRVAAGLILNFLKDSFQI